MNSEKLPQTPALFAPVGAEDSYYTSMLQDVYDRPICAPLQSEIKSLGSTQASTFQEYSDFLDNTVLPSVINVSSKRFMGHMTGPVPPFLCHINKAMVRMNQNQVKIETSGVGSAIEREVLAYFHRITFNQDDSFYAKNTHSTETALGVFTSGGTLSNVTALQYALAKALADDLGGLNETGLIPSLKRRGYKKVVIFASSLFHYSIKKAAKVMGIGKQAVLPFFWDKSKANESANALTQAIIDEQRKGSLVLALVGVAGTTESGAIDDLSALASIAKATGVHYHVDGAYGGAFLLSSHANKLVGLEQADSVTICGHKQLYIPIGCSMVLFQSAEFACFSENNTNYQARKGSPDLGKFTLEGTRPFSALLLHAAIQMHGKVSYAEVLDRNVKLANTFHDLLQVEESVEIYSKPDLNILLYRFIPSHLRKTLQQGIHAEKALDEINLINERLQQQQFSEGRFFVSFTKVFDTKIGRDMVWLRAVFMNPFTTREDMHDLIQDQKRILHSILPIN